MRAVFFSILFLFLFNNSYLDARNPSWWRVYFSAPEECEAQKNDPEEGLINTIDSAKKNFYGAFYNISSLDVVAAIIRAHKKGIDVRIVTERDYIEGEGISRLIMAGVPVVSDTGRGFMHNKFAVIDDGIIWTGSYNLTKNGTCNNNNNAIKIYSFDLANIYKAEFNEMFENKIFSNRKEYSPFQKFLKRYHVKVEKTNINVYFSPEDNIERILVNRLRKAKSSIHFMAFSFTSDKIGETMIKKFKEGVFVYGLFEKRGARSRYSEYMKMKLEGIPVKLDRNPFAMHHKVIIIDKERVITGSYNFSKRANKNNDENILIIDNKEIAYYYLEEFRKLYFKKEKKRPDSPI